MENIETLEAALKRIAELERENEKLREELDFVAGYESGMTMVEIANRNNVSERTIYRYKAYYDKIRSKNENAIE